MVPEYQLVHLQPELGAVCFTLPTVMQRLKHKVGPRAAIGLFPPPIAPPKVTTGKLDAYGHDVETRSDATVASMLVEASQSGFRTLDPQRCLASRILEKRYDFI